MENCHMQIKTMRSDPLQQRKPKLINEKKKKQKERERYVETVIMK